VEVPLTDIAVQSSDSLLPPASTRSRCHLPSARSIPWFRSTSLRASSVGCHRRFVTSLSLAPVSMNTRIIAASRRFSVSCPLSPVGSSAFDCSSRSTSGGPSGTVGGFTLAMGDSLTSPPLANHLKNVWRPRNRLLALAAFQWSSKSAMNASTCSP